MVMTEIPAIPLPPPSPEPQELPPEVQEALQPEAAEPAPPETPATPEPAPQPEAAAPAAPPEVDPILAQLEDTRLQLEEMAIAQRLLQTQMEHEQALRSEAASKAGYYKRVASDLAASRRAAPPPEEPYDPEEPSRTMAPETARFQQEIETLRQDAVERAQIDALNQFFSANPDVKPDAVAPFVQQARERYADWLESDNPKLIRKAAVMVLETAHLNQQKAATAAKRTERLTARASQLQRAAEDKRAAMIPGSGSSAPSSPQPKTLDKLDPLGKELEDVLMDPRTWA